VCVCVCSDFAVAKVIVMGEFDVAFLCTSQEKYVPNANMTCVRLSLVSDEAEIEE
jgi:hypothetical protein